MQLVCSYVALFSTLKQTHGTFAARDFERVTVAFYSERKDSSWKQLLWNLFITLV